MKFRHHPDNKIFIDDMYITPEDFALLEPAYSLWGGFAGLEYDSNSGIRTLIRVNGERVNIYVDNANLDLYLSRKATYQSALDAKANGAHIYNDGSNIIMQGPPALTATDGQITADGVDTEVITCTVSDNTYAGALTWEVTDPDGNTVSTNDNFASGSATLNLQVALNAVGTHIINVATAEYGTASIGVTAV